MITQTALLKIPFNVFLKQEVTPPVTEHVLDKWQDFPLELFLADQWIKCSVVKDQLFLLRGQRIRLYRCFEL